jgi:3-deoxy-D-manno-octulosonic acid kinase
MDRIVHNEKSLAIVYDAECLGSPPAEYFDIEYWTARQAIIGQAPGRGNTWLLDTPFGAVALRRYLRGGHVARVLKDRYVFTTVARSRPFKEFFTLASLYDQGLPVPRPIAALCEHHGVFAAGSIMTELIPNAETLADRLPDVAGAAESGHPLWSDVGRCIRRFHEAGVWHADLNARNIMLNGGNQVWLIDFDRARLSGGGRINGKGNLARLKRSLTKFWPTRHAGNLQRAWGQLEDAYHA